MIYGNGLFLVPSNLAGQHIQCVCSHSKAEHHFLELVKKSTTLHLLALAHPGNRGASGRGSHIAC